MEELLPFQIDRLLEDEPVAHIGVLAYGGPYVTPVSFVWDDGRLWFRTGPGTRLDAIVEHPRVSVEVSDFDHATGDWRSVVIRGDAEVIADDARGNRFQRLLREKYRRLTRNVLDMSPEVLPEEGTLVGITPVEVTGRSSGEGIDRHSRPGRL